jgi:hypothetical protein
MSTLGPVAAPVRIVCGSPVKDWPVEASNKYRCTSRLGDPDSSLVQARTSASPGRAMVTAGGASESKISAEMPSSFPSVAPNELVS